MDGTQEMTVTATRTYVWYKWRVFILLIPVVAYAILTSINNIFGVDLTNGWMGGRDPVGAGYAVLAGTPMLAYSLYQCVDEVFVRTPELLRLSKWGVVINRYPQRKLPWDSVTKIRILSGGDEPELVIFFQNSKEVKVPTRFLDASSKTLERLFADHGKQVELQ
ncbi:MAG: hypothetical protein AAF437_14200 [Pseudomonadota bacterium]